MFIYTQMQQIAENVSNRMRNMAFLCACFIVLHHVPIMDRTAGLGLIVTRYFSFGLYNAAVPFFFLASGYFVAGEYLDGVTCGRWLESVRKRIRSLLVPYFLFNTLVFSVRCFRGGLGLHPLSFPSYHLLWYVRVIFLFALVSPLVVWMLRRSRLWMVVTLSTFAVLWVGGSHFNVQRPGWLPMSWWLKGAFFYGAGMGMRFWFPDFIASRSIGVAAFFGGFILLWVSYWSEVAVIYACALVAFVAGLYSLVPSDSWPKRLVGFSFPVYLLHGLIIFALRSVLHVDGFRAAWHLPIGLCVLLVSLLIAWGAKRLFPRAYSVCVGGR